MGMPEKDRQHVTMQDVARHAGVSPQTVSNVVNGHSARVSDRRVIESSRRSPHSDTE